jgi:hypothetical protein
MILLLPASIHCGRNFVQVCGHDTPYKEDFDRMLHVHKLCIAHTSRVIYSLALLVYINTNKRKSRCRLPL